ncbi:hypothetical protein U9M48_031258 [Paspalum notatum var. saurae]|uniref:Uncharacterized protein n=1 Tax=Paspalum notatum var. saurae TaxID=547442 RepID=A0AAQ3U4R1_PASNO
MLNEISARQISSCINVRHPAQQPPPRPLAVVLPENVRRSGRLCPPAWPPGTTRLRRPPRPSVARLCRLVPPGPASPPAQLAEGINQGRGGDSEVAGCGHDAAAPPLLLLYEVSVADPTRHGGGAGSRDSAAQQQADPAYSTFLASQNPSHPTDTGSMFATENSSEFASLIEDHTFYNPMGVREGMDSNEIS